MKYPYFVDADYLSQKMHFDLDILFLDIENGIFQIYE